MQCKNCGDGDLEIGFEEIFEERLRMTFVEVQFRCRICGAVHLSKMNWRDYDLHSLSKKEVALP